ncbi:hypothetical protein K437DRAFT_262467 [Tilletiaria anomala UBC 951]|uniref:Rho-GAP domain-containing protein n=1 Tax=Tilletiaria anomala (strain ATCC 24038 / CBS 436.72 / UBC 951) TaxID=1037660 RepID=A0A066W080_TILAU|nr:uncharacterized protein K437DRAFT_262467 [Tilletiaria anomala UBC 951]KDN47337.1 hypothetical protein K437DRAFT_262467 [Tilletiaria anomala UBC 951]
MTLPSALAISLPPTFQTSFWPSGPTHVHAGSFVDEAPSSSSSSGAGVVPPSYNTYRPPLLRLYAHLQAGIDLNSRLLALVQHRAASEYAYAESLATPTPSPTYYAPILSGAAAQARSPSSFRALQRNVPGFAGVAGVLHIAEQETQRAHAEAHGRVASLLEHTILEPFGKWTGEHRERVKRSWDHVDEWLANIEIMGEEVDKLRAAYEHKCRAADEAEDDARFAPIENAASASSPAPHTPFKFPYSAAASHSTPPNRSEKVLNGHDGQRHISISQSAVDTSASPESVNAADKDDSKPVVPEDDEEKLKRRDTLREKFGFDKRSSHKSAGSADSDDAALDNSTLASAAAAADESLSSVSGGGGTALKRSSTLSTVLSRIDNATRAASTSPIVSNLRAAVAGVGSLGEPKHIRLRRDAQNVEDKYRTAVERLDRLRAEFDEVAMEHLGLTQRWEGDRQRAVKSAITQYTRAFEPLARISGGGGVAAQRLAQLPSAYSSTQDFATAIRVLATAPYKPLPQVFHPYYHHDLSTLAGAGSEGFGMNLLVWDRARALAGSPMDDGSAIAQSAGGVAATATAAGEKLPEPPRALLLLLHALSDAYANEKRWPSPASTSPATHGAKDDEASTSAQPQVSQALQNAEKRRAWIYEVPLRSVHTLRFALIAALRAQRPDKEILANLLGRADPPVLAALVKTWAMELEETLVMQSCWDMVWSVYRAASAQEEEALKGQNSSKGEGEGEVGAATDAKSAVDGDKAEKEAEEASAQADVKGKQPAVESAVPPTLSKDVHEKIAKGILDDLGVVLLKLPKVHLSCLDSVVSHLSQLYKSTEDEDADTMWLQKLGMSTGRALLRPPSELPQTIYARHPALLVIDLVKNYDKLFPDIVAAKAKESGLANQAKRRAPVRRRTKPIDMRTSRSSLAAAHGDAPPLPLIKDAASPSPSASLSVLNNTVVQPSDLLAPATGPLQKPKIITKTGKIDGGDGVVKDDASGSALVATPTPISERMLGSLPTTTTGKDTQVKNELNMDSHSLDVIDAGSENNDTLPASSTALHSTSEGKEGDADATIADGSAAAQADKPLSNVARLSRQFAAPTSGIGGPRGPRPAGSR